MGKRGEIGAVDQRERERRQKIRDAFNRALAAKDSRAFWEIMRAAGIPDESELAVKLYAQW
jgi:formiminotetrahydrofolate cyclodeaminase